MTSAPRRRSAFLLSVVGRTQALQGERARFLVRTLSVAVITGQAVTPESWRLSGKLKGDQLGMILAGITFFMEIPVSPKVWRTQPLGYLIGTVLPRGSINTGYPALVANMKKLSTNIPYILRLRPLRRKLYQPKAPLLNSLAVISKVAINVQLVHPHQPTGYFDIPS